MACLLFHAPSRGRQKQSPLCYATPSFLESTGNLSQMVMGTVMIATMKMSVISLLWNMTKDLQLKPFSEVTCRFITHLHQMIWSIFVNNSGRAVGGRLICSSLLKWVLRYSIPFVRNLLGLKCSSTGHKLTFLNWIGAEFM